MIRSVNMITVDDRVAWEVTGDVETTVLLPVFDYDSGEIVAFVAKRRTEERRFVTFNEAEAEALMLAVKK